MNNKAAQNLPGLYEWLKRLLQVASEIQGVQYSEDDHFAFMALSFLGKQVDHTRSIFALDNGRDVGLIARSMLEGMCQLLWAANDSDARALRWRAFAWVHDWRMMQAKIQAGETVKVADQSLVEKNIQQYGSQFLTKKAQKAQQQGTPLPADPYCDNWTGHTIREIFESVGATVLYLKVYKAFSDWHHWSPGGIGTALSHQEDQTIYSSTSLADTATALATTFQCLLQTVEVVDKHLKLGKASKISKLKDEYIAWHQTQNESAPAQ